MRWTTPPFTSLQNLTARCLAGLPVTCRADLEPPMTPPGPFPHPPVHGVVGQAVGFLVAAAQGVAHFEAFERRRRRLASSQSGRRPGLATLYWPFICLTISSESETTRRRLRRSRGPSQDRQQRRVLGVIVGLDAEKSLRRATTRPLRVFDDRAIAGGAGVAARAAVAVGGEPFRGGIRGCRHSRK